MNRVLRGVGAVLIGVAVLIALYPFLSTWRISDRILSELPTTVDGQSVDDRDQFGTAIFDPDFVLATRTYDSATVEDVERSLAEAGYERYSAGQRLWWARECCGAWDAALVDVVEDDDGQAVAEMSVFDTDVQASWPFFPVMAVIPGLIGLTLVAGNPCRQDRGSTPAAQPASV